MKYYIIAGEASGDLHGANLIKAIRQQDPSAHIRCWGGDKMQSAGAELVRHYRELSFMGFWEVITNIFTILKNLNFCKKDIAQYKPDAIIFIDYPGFNMRIARWAKEQGYGTHYYISPQIWAWKEGRISAIRRDVDNMMVILPFEKDFYEKKHHFPVTFVGHPLLDELENRPPVSKTHFLQQHQLDNRPIVALLPGSRKQEIEKMLSVMLSVVSSFPDYQFVIAAAPSLENEVYAPYIAPTNTPIPLVRGHTYELLSVSCAAVVTSGTATLETALMGIPQVVCYKANEISYQIAKQLVKLQYISLVNLIMQEKIVTELIQGQLNTQNLQKELADILQNNTTRQQIQYKYALLQEKLGQKGASLRAAQTIITQMKNKNK